MREIHGLLLLVVTYTDLAHRRVHRWWTLMALVAGLVSTWVSPFPWLHAAMGAAMFGYGYWGWRRELWGGAMLCKRSMGSVGVFMSRLFHSVTRIRRPVSRVSSTSRDHVAMQGCKAALSVAWVRAATKMYLCLFDHSCLSLRQCEREDNKGSTYGHQSANSPASVV